MTIRQLYVVKLTR